MDEKKVIETKLTEYENEQLKLLKSVFDMGCAFKMLALQKEASDWELKYLNEKKDFAYAQEQIGRFLIEVDLLKKELAKKESDTAREILTELLDFVNGWFEGVENNDFGVEFNRISKDFAEKYGVDLME
jgi:hypothetical protein